MNPLFPILLQNIQLIHATFQCFPKSERPKMDSDIQDWIDRIEMNCKLIYNRLEQGMNQELWDEFLDQNTKLMRFISLMQATPTDDFISFLNQFENRYTTGKAVTEDFGEFMDKIII